MPFRCTNCNKVTQQLTEEECCDNSNPKECPKIHYLNRTATGPVYSRQMKKQGIAGSKPSSVLEPVELRLGCDTKKPLEQATILPSLVSCPECLSFLESIRPVKVNAEQKSSSLDGVDLTTDDIQQLEAMGLNPSFVH
jgi:hypothetical protein